MKTLIIFLVSLIVLGNIPGAQAMSPDSSANPIDKTERELEKINVKFQNPLRDVNTNLLNYSLLLETFNQFKLYDLEFVSGLLNKIKNQNTLSGSELFVLRRTITTYYKINKKILDFAKVYDFGGFKMSKTFASHERNIPLIKAHLIWLSGHLLVLDHLEAMHSLLNKTDGKFRRIVKNALRDKSDGTQDETKTLNDLIKMSEYTVEMGESLKFSQQINLVRAIQLDLKTILSEEASTAALVDAITSNKTATDIAQGKNKFQISNYNLIDTILSAVDNITGLLSRLFGNIAGSIHWRTGYLYKNNIALDIAKNNLMPMDILLEKSPFVLTDKFIPGHYGHVAVYLGTKEQLLAIDMWNHPDIIPYQTEIEKGHVILEAVRSGVRLNSLDEFLNIDELTIMRKEDGLKNPDLLIEEVTRGMDQIGKAYDFNFDIATLDKIVCSELIYITFGNVLWPTQYRMGRATITPDDVAEVLFHKNTKFKIQNYMLAKEEHRIEIMNMSYIADEFNYEKRTKDGNPIEDEHDQTNSYWKKETKCYNIAESDDQATYSTDRMDQNKRVCKTSYKEFYYEERESI